MSGGACLAVLPLLPSPGAGRSLVDREAGLSRVGRSPWWGLAGSMERTIITAGANRRWFEAQGQEVWVACSPDRTVGGLAFFGLARRVRARARSFVSVVCRRGNWQRNSLERGLRPPLRGLISAQVRPWRWRCGTKSRFFVHGAWPAPRSLAGSKRCQERCFGGALRRFPRTYVPDTSFFSRKQNDF